MNFVIRHPPRATVARSQVGPALVFAEPFDKVIALAHVKAAGATTLEDVDEIHVRKWSGRLDLNQRPPAPKAGALIQAELRPGVAYNLRDVRYGINNKPAAFPTRWRRRDALIQAELRPARHAIYVKAVRISTTRAIRSPCGQAVRCLWLHSGSPQLPRGLVSRTAFQNPHAPAPVASD